MTASEDFTSVTDPFRAELLAHCYRMAGSADEAEDLVQKTYLRAWRSYQGFQGRSSVRTWLYRIATWFAGRESVARFLSSHVLRAPGQFRLVATAANGQPAFATYERGRDGVYRAHALQVLTIAPAGIARIVIFLDAGLFGPFRLPPVYDAAAAGALLTGVAAGAVLTGTAGAVPTDTDRAGHGAGR